METSPSARVLSRRFIAGNWLEEGLAVASHRTPLVVPALKAVQAAMGISKVEMLFAPPLEQVVVDLVSQEDLVPLVWLAMVAMGISSHSLQ